MNGGNKIPNRLPYSDVDSEMIDAAVRELRTAITHVLEIVSRYFQFRVRDLVARGWWLRYDTRIEIEGLRLRFVASIEIPEDLVVEYARHYTAYTKIARRIMRMADITDRYKYRPRIGGMPADEVVEGEGGEDVEVELVEPGRREGEEDKSGGGGGKESG